MHVQVNPLALAARGIGFEDVRNALTAATLDQPKGNLEGERQVYTLDTNDQLFDAQSFARPSSPIATARRYGSRTSATAIDSSQLPRTGAWSAAGRPNSC